MQLSGNTVLITGGASGIDSDCQADPSPQEFVAGRMQGLRNDVPEIGFGLTASLIRASRAELDESFRRMNRHL
jgi:short-subunit dehydrogenase involved in D-alanine esterification of teichoic acids